MAPLTTKTLNRYFILLFIIIILITLLPIKYPITIKSYGKIYPAKELYITKVQNESISTEYIDRLHGGLKNYSINSFERGDRVSFVIEPKVIIGSEVCVGDTIGKIFSSRLLQLESEVSGQIDIAIANLNVFQSQENQSLVDEAQYQVEYAQTQFENQKIVFDRISQLYINDLISDEKFDSVRTVLQLYEKEIQIAEAQLKTVISGAKPETINFLRSEIKALQDQHSILIEQINQGILISPISGIANNPNVIDTILSIQDTTQHIALFPILWKYAGFVSKGQEVHIRIPEKGVWTGIVRLIDNNVQVIGGDARVIITVELEEEYSNINVGQVVEGKIKFKSTTILSKMSRFVKNTIDFRA
ncbi:hypothetical protein ACFL5D_04905 [Candidatus Neomarinimicrobiota bacterium]